MDIGIRADGLTTRDFEAFAIELVKRRFYNDSLHGFPEGRDDGIDGIDDIKQPTLVVQAKRWQIDKHGQTAVNLLKKEIDTIVETKEKYNWKTPFNYIIVTSMRLSPANLKAIRDYADEKLPSAITSDDQIIFSSTLTTLSQEQSYKDLFAHYGLIEEDISKVLKNDRLNAIEAESKDYFADTDVDYFVETAFLGEAYHILQKEHILLVQGPPGIGKTTTCSMLGHLFLNNQENKIDVIVRRVEEINEVITLYNQTYRDTEDRGLLVIFDDFLGRNTFDVGERVLQDVRQLYSTSVHSNNLFICLNSRTQILKDATGKNSEFEQLIDDKFTEQRNIMIDLSSYSDLDKAKIFRRTVERHLNTLTPEKQQLLVDSYNSLRERDWTRIIWHRNYFPRLIDLIVKNFMEASDGFYQHVLSNLDNPTRLYDELFARLADEEKYLLFSLWHFERLPIPEEWLRTAFQALKLYPTFDLGQALKKLDGSWLRFVIEGKVKKVDVLNPSIVDFLNQKQVEFPQLIEHIYQSSVYLSQISKGIGYFRPIFNFSWSKKDEKQRLEMYLECLVGDLERFRDREAFVSDKLLAIISSGRYDEYRVEFLSLLHNSKWGWLAFDFPFGWYHIIKNIDHGGNINLRRDVVKEFDNREFVDNLLSRSHFLHFDSLVYCVDSFIKELIVFDKGDELGKLHGIEDLEHYQLFRDKKIELLQYDLDSGHILRFVKFDDWALKSKDIPRLLAQVYEKIEEKLSDDYRWKDLDASMFDYSNLQQHLEEFLQRKGDHWSYVGDDDSWQEKESLEASWEDINALLNTPL